MLLPLPSSHRTNPLRVDTDGDGRKDRREVRAGTNPVRRD
ncbi:thrombospondin type 3 repeat-containing protein [Pseudonocardia bannensis]